MKLNLRSIDLNLLTIFDAIMVEKKMSAAATRLHMTQPAVSQALGRLRQMVGDELFVRTYGGMRPTPRAEALAGPVRSILSQIQTALDPEQEFDPRSSRRVFRVSFGPYGELNILPHLAQQIQKANSMISIQSVATDAGMALLLNGELDFCFLPILPKHPSVETVLCGRTDFVVIAKKDHPRVLHRLTLEDYVREKHVVVQSNLSKEEFVHRDLREIRKEREIIAEVNNSAAVASVVAQTDAIATVPRSLAEFFRAQLAIDIYPFPMDVPPSSIYLTWHKSMSGDKAHMWLREQVLNEED